MKTRKVRDFVEHTREVTKDDAFADELARRLEATRLTRLLSVLRNRAGLSQKELAEKLGCTQGKVSKLENADDVDVTLGELVAYATAVGFDAQVTLLPQGARLVDEVALHLDAIHKLVGQLTALAGDDDSMGAAIVAFVEQAARNLLGLLQKTAAKLSPEPKSSRPPLRVEAPELGTEKTPGIVRPRKKGRVLATNGA